MLFAASVVATLVALGWLGSALKRRSRTAARLRQINVPPNQRPHGDA